MTLYPSKTAISRIPHNLNYTLVKKRLTVLTLLGLAATSASSPIAFVERQSNENVTLTLLQTTDRLLFNTSIADFLTARNAREGIELGLDWTADGCSSSPDDPFGFDCKPSFIHLFLSMIVDSRRSPQLLSTTRLRLPQLQASEAVQ
jgi:hypothetical protein